MEKKTDQKGIYLESLKFHNAAPYGKLAVHSTKPLVTHQDLALAYSPGVAGPCIEISKDPQEAYNYTSKGNLVAVISNGTAVLGLGNIGALSSKPVMEGKSVLFKKFSDIDSVDIEVDTEDEEEFIKCVAAIAPTFGGINLEDIKAPSCFRIEKALIDKLDIPVFHDDQHGTAIIVLASLLNAVDITNRKLETIKVVFNGAGSATIACASIMLEAGVKKENIIICDSKGVVYEGRTERMNEWKQKFAHPTTKARTLTEALEGADAFIGLSVKDALEKEGLLAMKDNPIVFALANPEPEINPSVAKSLRPNAIIATGRTDYPNQVNNAIGFPYIFRGALDCRAKKITTKMKIAAANALASLAREYVPIEVSEAYGGEVFRYGPNYIIPKPFDARLGTVVPVAVAKAAMEEGVARQELDLEDYRKELLSRLNMSTCDALDNILQSAKSKPKKVIFAEGEEKEIIQGAFAFYHQGYGTPILIGKEENILDNIEKLGLDTSLVSEGLIEIQNAKTKQANLSQYYDFLYKRACREGLMKRDCIRLVNRNRNIFGACMLEMGEADSLITGSVDSFIKCYKDIRKVISNDKSTVSPFCITAFVSKNKTIFLADVALKTNPTAQELVDIAIEGSKLIKKFGHTPRVALTSFNNFFTSGDTNVKINKAIELLNSKKPDFEYDGPMTAKVALDFDLLKDKFPCSNLTGPANFLVMPNLEAGHIAGNLMESMTNCNSIGPLLIGLDKPCYILPLGSKGRETCNLAAISTLLCD